MKRLISIFLIAFIVPLMCMAANLQSFTKPIVVQGGYDSVASISVEPIPIQAESFLMGMPFPLDDPTAQYGASVYGRQIATWHVLTNDLFVLDVESEIMHHYSENNTGDEGYSNGLGYRLVFTYLLSYKSGNQILNSEKFFTVNVPVSPRKKVQKTKDINMLGNVQLDPNSLVGSAQGAVFFSFDEPTSARIKNNYELGFQDGNYNAVVKMILRVKDK